AGLEARRQPPLARAVEAERALLDDALRTDPVRQVRLIGVDLLAGDLGRLPVEAPRVVRARGLAVAAADAPVVVDDHDAVGLLPRRLDRANLHARRVVALVALHRHVVLAGRG